jgi:hypothetical protein
MTSRRLVLLPVSLLGAAFSLAFRLRGWIRAAFSAPAVELTRSTRAHSLPPVLRFDLSGTVAQLGRPEPAGRASVSPPAHGSRSYRLSPLASSAGRSISSQSRQIPLLVGGMNTLHSTLQSRVIPTHVKRLGRRSLNPTLSLHGGVA